MVKNLLYCYKKFKSIAMHYVGRSSCWLRIVGFLFNLFPYWALFLMPMVIEFHSYDSKAADAESSKNHMRLKIKLFRNCWNDFMSNEDFIFIINLYSVNSTTKYIKDKCYLHKGKTFSDIIFGMKQRKICFGNILAGCLLSLFFCPRF